MHTDAYTQTQSQAGMHLGQIWMPESAIMRDGGTGKMALQIDTGSEAALGHFQNKDTHNQMK